MARVRGRDTRPEKLVRSVVHNLGFRFRVAPQRMTGKPDIVLPRHNKVVFVHGCFWHQHKGCARAARPKTRVDFWNAKLDRNVSRDSEVILRLEEAGWNCLIVWECETSNVDAMRRKLRRFLKGRRQR
jgi:DNA mismatch endonuclease (patch repair protein)